MSTTGAWMPLYVGDYLADTMHLTAEEHGAYLLLLMHSWRNGALPDDDRKLAAISRVSLKVWRAGLGETVRSFFRPAAQWETPNGENPYPAGIINPRLERERMIAVGNADRRSQAAEKAAKARWGRDASRIPHADADAMRDACPPPSPSPSSSTKKNSPSLRSGEGAPAPRRACRLPEGWVPFPADEAFARNLGLDVERVTANFRDFWRAKPGKDGTKLDWSATWRVWCRRDAEQSTRRPRHSDESRTAWADTDPLFARNR